MASIQVTFSPTYEDYLKVNRATTFNKPTLVLIGLMIITTLITLVGWYLGWLTVDSNRLLFFVLPPALFVFFMVYTMINLHRHAHQMAEQSPIITWYLDHAGIRVNESGQSQEFTWDHFSTAQDFGSYYILFFKSNPTQHLFILKSALTASGQEVLFRQLIAANLGKVTR